MQNGNMNKIKIEKFNINNTRDIIDVGLLLLTHKEVVPTLHRLKKKSENDKELYSRLQNYTQIAQIMDGKTLRNHIDPIVRQYFIKEQIAGSFKNGLYIVRNPNNNDFIGMFGLKVEEVKHQKIQQVSLNSFIDPINTNVSQETKELKKGLGMDAARKYFADVLLKNIHEFNPEATFFVDFLKTNNAVISYMKHLRLYDKDKLTNLEYGIDKISGSMKDFIKVANLCVNDIPQNIVRSKL
jgi:hypothetical protein